MKKTVSSLEYLQKTRFANLGSGKYKKVSATLFIIAIAAFGSHYLVGSHADANTVKVNFPPVAISGGSTNTGYYLAGSDGGVFALGTANFHGSLPGSKITVNNIVAMSTDAGDNGYWLLGSDGGVFAYGNAVYHGGTPSGHTGNFVGIAGASNGGYWLVDSTGQIYAYDTSAYTNPTGNSSPFVGIAATADGKGFWMVDKTGQVYAYGDATYHGGAPAGDNNIVGITAGLNGGYYLVGGNGGIVALGGDTSYGSLSGQTLNAPVVGIQHTSDYKGYWMTATDGGVFAFGDAQFQGRVSYTPPAAPAPATTQAVTPTVAQSNNGATLGTQKVSAGGSISTSNSNGVVTSSNSGGTAPTDPTIVKVNAPAIGILSDTKNNGYLELTTDGGVFARGSAPFIGSASTNNISNIIGLTRPRNSDSGYYLVGSDGGVFAYGLPYEGSMGGKHLNQPVVGIAATPDGKGYWLAAGDGGVFAFGDANYYGSMSGKSLNSPIVGISTTPDGRGYWLVGADGGIFAFGDAKFYGSMGSKTINKPIVAISSTPDGKGYWLLASDGGIFGFGDAGFYGSMGSQSINGWAVGISTTPDGKGYYIQASDGAVFAFGDAKYMGRLYYPPPTITMSANPSTVWAGWPLNINWQVGNSGDESSVFLKGEGTSGGYKVNDNVTVRPTTIGLSPYSLTVVGPGGTDAIQVVVNVVIPPPSASISLAPNSISIGDGSILEWSTTNVTGATISAPGVPGFPVNVGPSGNQVISGLAAGNYTFSLTATNSSGSVTQSSQLSVYVPAPVSSGGGGGGLTGSGDSSVTPSGPSQVKTTPAKYIVDGSTMVCADVTDNNAGFENPPSGVYVVLATGVSINSGRSDYKYNNYLVRNTTASIPGANHNTTYCTYLGMPTIAAYNIGLLGQDANFDQLNRISSTDTENDMFTVNDIRIHTSGQPDLWFNP